MLKFILTLIILMSISLSAQKATKTNITKLYIATFDRSPDSAGLKYWLNSGFNLEEIMRSFFDQKETKQKYPSNNPTSQFIKSIYKNLFNRNPDNAGYIYWYQALESKEIDRPLFILAVVNGALNSDKKILDNKTKVSLAYIDDGYNDTKKATEIIEDVSYDDKSVSDALCKFRSYECEDNDLDSSSTSINNNTSSNLASNTSTNNQHKVVKSISLFVSNKGDDYSSGTKDAPFKTISKAVEKARDLKKYKVTIFIRDGIYPIQKTISLGSEDDRDIDKALIISAYKDENVTIVGAKKITNFREVLSSDEAYPLLSMKAKTEVLVSDLSELDINLTEPVYYFDTNHWSYGNEFFVGLKKLRFSYYPKEHLLNFLSDGSSHNYTKNHDDDNKTILYSNNSDEDIDTINSWKDEKNIFTYARWKYDWSDSRTKIDSIDINNSAIYLVNMPYRGYQKDSVNSNYKGLGFYAYNLASELDEDTYYIDYKAKKLYYYPKYDDYDKDKYLTNLDDIFHLENVSFVTIKNLSLSMAKRNAISVTNSNDINISQCNITKISNRGINFDDVNNSIIEDTNISILGGGGIRVTGGDRADLIDGNITVRDNIITKTAQLVRYYDSGIEVYGVGNNIIENTIYDLPHTAIYFNGNNHLIESNTIHDVVKNAHDAGAIYGGQDWSQRGTVIRDNFLYNIRGENDLGAAGIYLDDLYSGTIVEDNVLYNIYRAILIGGGRDNIINHNLIANSTLGLHTDDRGVRIYDSDEKAKIHMGAILNRVPWQSKLWKNRYPNLYNIYDNNPREPMGNKLTYNRIIETKYPFEFTGDSKQYLELVDNNYTKKGTYTLKKMSDFNSSKAFKEYLRSFFQN